MKKQRPVRRLAVALVRSADLCLAKNQVDLGATGWADALAAATLGLLVDDDFEGHRRGLCLALHAVRGLTLDHFSHGSSKSEWGAPRGCRPAQSF